MKQQLHSQITASIKRLIKSSELPKDISYEIQISHTKEKKFGDYTTNIAMILAKAAGQNPRALAQKIINDLGNIAEIDSIEIAGPGFINFFVTKDSIQGVINDILTEKENYGCTNFGAGKRINVEFVSANPTGPLHVGHGRGAAYGATLANLLNAIGYKADTEYYVNDAGRQMHVLAASIWLRYLSLFYDLPSFPASGYKGDYVIAIAEKLREDHTNHFYREKDAVFNNLSKDKDAGGDPEIYIDEMVERTKNLLGERDYSTIFDAGLQTILNDIKEDLAEFGVTFNKWFFESSLVTSGDIQKAISKLQETGFIYEKDGALWFRATQFGDEKDRVVVRENGLTTYFASDIGYHLNKYERGYDQIIDIFGADHHGYAPRIRAFLQAENLDVDKLKVLLVQFAILYRGKEKASMSTRGGEFVTLRQLREEVGNDAARFFYIIRKCDQHLDFDLELAKSQSQDNPVYYIQYAHARICSVMRQLHERELKWNEKEGLKNIALLIESHEEQLINTLQRYKETLHHAAIKYEPHILANYLLELANNFHTYYNAQQFLVDNENLRNARLNLINATKQILANGLTLLGVSCPTEM